MRRGGKHVVDASSVVTVFVAAFSLGSAGRRGQEAAEPPAGLHWFGCVYSDQKLDAGTDLLCTVQCILNDYLWEDFLAK